MRKVTQVAVCTQKVLNEVARQAGYVSGFVQRESKLSADKFVQILVFGWLANASASLNELTQTAAARGVEISPQGLDKRFNEAAAECLRMVLAKAISNLITADCAAVGILKKFTQVWLYDSSIVRLPQQLITHCRFPTVS